MSDLSANPMLSAVARRKAAQLQTTASSELSSLDLLAVAPVPVVSVDEAPILPLKRKSSARSLKQLENSESPKTEPQLRKRSKPQRYFQTSGDKADLSTNTTPRREYSPSQPLADSSDEDNAPVPDEADVLLDEINEEDDLKLQARYVIPPFCLYLNSNTFQSTNNPRKPLRSRGGAKYISSFARRHNFLDQTTNNDSSSTPTARRLVGICGHNATHATPRLNRAARCTPNAIKGITSGICATVAPSAYHRCTTRTEWGASQCFADKVFFITWTSGSYTEVCIPSAFYHSSPGVSYGDRGIGTSYAPIQERL